MEELNALPYLDLVVRETLRLHAPVTITGRIAMADDILPLSTLLVDKYGNMLTEIPIRKGQRIAVPILALHTAKSVWGEDALEFKCVSPSAQPCCVASDCEIESHSSFPPQARTVAQPTQEHRGRAGSVEPPADLPGRSARVHRLQVLARRVRLPPVLDVVMRCAAHHLTVSLVFP